MNQDRKRTQGRMLACLMVILLFAPSADSTHGDLELPVPSAPDEYGDVAIEKFSGPEKVMPVIFSHWFHRTKYTCRVCHVELEFSMKSNDTGVRCGGGEMTGKYCTKCHDGKTAFAPKTKEGTNCKRCHNANASPNRELYNELKQKLPATEFGNGIDWTKSLADGLIKPVNSLTKGYTPMTNNKTLSLEAEMSGIPPAVFPHKTHVEWLDCDMCHPDIFNIKKKTTKHFAMRRILNKEFCGVCHLKIAFPLDDCRRCHPKMRR